MKKMILCLGVTACLYACGNGGSKTDTSKGESLIKSSDCLTCHKVEEKLIGPSYRSISEKYPNTPENVATLTDKVIKGGSGNWGTIPMAAHANISKEDATEMVKYVLSLKK